MTRINAAARRCRRDAVHPVRTGTRFAYYRGTEILTGWEIRSMPIAREFFVRDSPYVTSTRRNGPNAISSLRSRSRQSSGVNAAPRLHPRCTGP